MSKKSETEKSGTEISQTKASQPGRSEPERSGPWLVDRRLFVTGTAGLALAGCDTVTASKQGQGALKAASNLTYQTQRTLQGRALATEYPKSAISAYFKPNGSIDPKDPTYKKLAAETFASFSMPVGGHVEEPRSFTLADLKALTPRTQVTRHDCVEGWSCIGEWTGAPLALVLDLVKPKPEARFVVFHCFDRYDTDYTTQQVSTDNTMDGQPQPFFYGSIGMDSATHPQTILAYAMNGQDLPVEHGAPLRLRVERQLGYKNTKYIKQIELVSSFKDIQQGHGGFWEDQGYEWWGGI